MPAIFEVSEFLSEIKKLDDRVIAWVEEPFYTAMDGRTSLFHMAFNYGVLIKSIQINNIPYNQVKPITWKSAFKLSKDKNKSMELCLELFPKSNNVIYVKKGGKLDGIAESILIAYYGKLQQDRRLKFK